MTRPTILICTVGTGNVDQLRETLLEPLKKSIRKGEWGRVVLVPSQLTRENARKLSEEVQDVPIEIRELPESGIEDNADACFAHFDQILATLRDQHVPAESLLVDFTRGTKAMSAALVLAAVRHELPQLRYISGKRDERGMVMPGMEVVSEVRTTIATARRRLDDAYGYFKHGNFAAVLEGLPLPGQCSELQWPQGLSGLAGAVRSIAAFCIAWDRLDYREAEKAAPLAKVTVDPPWNQLAPPSEICDWVAKLAKPWPEGNSERAAPLRNLVADLLANGERRLRAHQFEDAIIRGYRILELIGQIRLFERGLDSAELPPEHPEVEKFQKKLLRKKSHPLAEKNGKLQASREQVARLLKQMSDPLAENLLKLGDQEDGQVRLSKRNYSIWIHGFEAIAGSNAEPIQRLFAELEALLIKDDPAAVQRLRYARWLDISQRLA